MGRIINISDKFDTSKPVLQYNGVDYTVDDSIGVAFSFQEALSSKGDIESFEKAFAKVLGPEAVKALNIKSLSMKNVQVLAITLLALIQDVSYEDAEARFQQSV